MNRLRLEQGTETLYDDANRVKKQSWSLFQTEDGKTTTKTYTGRYTYNTGNGTMSTADFGTGRTATFAYDNLQRLTSETMAGLYTKSYTYRDISSTRTTTQIASESYTGLCSGWSNRTASYTYDAMGNIATITVLRPGNRPVYQCGWPDIPGWVLPEYEPVCVLWE